MPELNNNGHNKSTFINPTTTQPAVHNPAIVTTPDPDKPSPTVDTSTSPKPSFVKRIHSRFNQLNTKLKYSLLFVLILFLLVLIWAISVFSPLDMLNDKQANETTQSQLVDVVDNLNESQNFNDLLKKDQRSFNLISGSANFTIFTPSDEAIKNIPQSIYGNQPTQEKIDQINAQIIQNHIISGSFDIDKLSKLSSLNTLAGETLVIKNQDGKVSVNDNPIDSSKSVQSQNGYIHFVDVVFYPQYLDPAQNKSNDKINNLKSGNFAGTAVYGSESNTTTTAQVSITDIRNGLSLNLTDITLKDLEVSGQKSSIYSLDVSLFGTIKTDSEQLILQINQVNTVIKKEGVVIEDVSEKQTIQNVLRDQNLILEAIESQTVGLQIEQVNDQLKLQLATAPFISFEGGLQIDPQLPTP
jgi:uncharacterized surface protein with fasciclin (FAS1) repeats